MTIRIYNDKIRFVADSDGDAEIDLLIESDGLRFTKPLTTAFSVPYSAGPPAIPKPPPMQGTVSAFTSGGQVPNVPTQLTTIDKFPFSISSGTGTDVGDLSLARYQVAGQSSTTDGFSSGGTSPFRSTIDKFPFAISGGTATSVGNLTAARSQQGSLSSVTDGFTTGGIVPAKVNTIDKFPFSISSGTAIDVGDLSEVKGGTAGHATLTDGFASGGSSPGQVSTIDKFPFAISGGTATDVGDLNQVKDTGAGSSSTTDGFSSGGYVPTGYTLNIHKFPFAISGGTSTDVGDLANGNKYYTGQHSSTTDGFVAGTNSPSLSPNKSIDKFPFNISSGTATDVGDLFQHRAAMASQQD